MVDKIDFDDYAEEYDDINANIGTFFSKDSGYFNEYKVKIVASALSSEPKSILEYGCGVGKNIEFLLKHFKNSKIYGCDISQKSIDIARRNYPSVNVFLCDKIPEKKFDFVFISNVYHHVPISERENVTKEIYKLLEDDGTGFVFEHNPYNPITRRIVDKCPYDKDAHLLSMKDLLSLYSKNGFIVQKKKFTLFFPEILKCLWGIEKYIGFIPLGGQYYIQFRKV